METRDALLPGAERDGSSEEDVLTTGLAKEAELLFQSGRFAECVEVLNKLLSKRDGDPKVLHNIAVAEYYHHGCSDPKKLLDVFSKVKKASERLSFAAVEQPDVSTTAGINVASATRTTSLNQLTSVDSGNLKDVDEVDISVVTFNTAAILYQLHEYACALSVLEPLYDNIEPVDERTALHICLLMLDISLASQDASRAADVIHYLEKSFGVGQMTNQTDSGSIVQHQSTNQGSKVSSWSSTPPEVSSSESSASGNVNENPIAGTLSDDSLEFENLYSTLDGGSQRLSRSVNEFSKTIVDRAATMNDLKLKIQLYRVRLLLLTRNLKAAKREVKLAMNLARGRDSSIELLLKSQLEYARGNHKKSIKLLMTSMNKTEPASLCLFNNNVGCLHFQLKGPHTSALFFAKALKSSLLLRSEKPMKTTTFSQDKSLYILYNCGLQHLVCGNPSTAAQCFGKASLLFYNKPVLWLRLAECCISAVEKRLLESSGEIKLHVAGSGRWRQLLLNEDISSRSRSLKLQSILEDDEQCKLSLPFARRCLKRALVLLDKLEKKGSRATPPNPPLEEETTVTKSIKGSGNKSAFAGDQKTPTAASSFISSVTNCDNKESRGSFNASTTLHSSMTSFEELCMEENHMIKQAVLANLAYIELFLENPSKALSAARSLLQLPDCSKIYSFLARSYAAEALCHLNRPKEAAELFSPYFNETGHTDLPFSNDDREKWIIKRRLDGDELLGLQNSRTGPEEPRGLLLKPEEARAISCVNHGMMFSLQGNLEQASLFVQKAISYLPKDPRVLMAGVYVDLLQGKPKDALAKLKQCSNTRYLSTGVNDAYEAGSGC